MSETQGRFVWYELRTTDVDASTRFYGDVVGWSTEAFGGGPTPYVIWKAGDEGVGGLVRLAEAEHAAGWAPGWIAYVQADDVDALAKRAVALGARTCHAPEDIPGVGRFAVIADPQGAVIAMIAPQGPERPEPPEPPPGHVSWRELMAGESESALAFYAKLFGWEAMETLESPNGPYRTYGRKGRMLGGMMTRPEGYPWPPHWLFYTVVADLDGAVARVRAGGGRVLLGPMEVPGGTRVAHCVDPQGAPFGLHGR